MDDLVDNEMSVDFIKNVCYNKSIGHGWRRFVAYGSGLAG